MDELEIEGKRYISTRRAAKEHKYTSDYVGQLIRGGKVVGKKVGRSWYVDETSLNTYLRGEVKKPEPVAVAVAAPVVSKAPEPVVAVVEEKVSDAPVVQENPTPEKVEEKNITDTEAHTFTPVIIKTKTIDEHHVPIRTTAPTRLATGLRYVADDEPALPQVKQRSAVTTVAPTAMRAPVADEHVEDEQIEEEAEEVTPKNFSGTFALASLAIAGLVTLAATTFLASTLNARIVVQEGQVAGVGYTFQ